MKVALVTCERFRDLTSDDTLLAEAIMKYSIVCRSAIWNDPREDWSTFDCAVVRSTWDYFEHPEAFAQWIDKASARTRLINPSRLMHWNMHKRYLFALERAGLSIVPTILIGRGSNPSLRRLLRDIGTGDFVLKPAIAASAYRTYVFGDGHHAVSTAPHVLRNLARDGDVLAQQFLREIYDPGERSLVYIGGSFSHAVRRPPLSTGAAGGEWREERIIPSQAEIAAAWSALHALPEEPLYARIDLLPLRSGAIAITEVEVIEPSLYFSHHPTAAALFADAIAQGVSA